VRKKLGGGNISGLETSDDSEKKSEGDHLIGDEGGDEESELSRRRRNISAMAVPGTKIQNR